MTSLPQQQPAPSKFAELSENECIKLLADHTAGRVGFMGLRRPTDLAGDLPVPQRRRDLPNFSGGCSVRTDPANQRGIRDRQHRRAEQVRLERSRPRIRRSDGSIIIYSRRHGKPGPVPWADGIAESLHRDQAAQDQRSIRTRPPRATDTDAI